MGGYTKQNTGGARNQGTIPMANRTPPKRLRRRTSKKDNLDWDARYGKGYKRQCAIAHRRTHNFCCYCLMNRSTNLHHAYYGKDEIGVSTFPVCEQCHRQQCHSRQNWIKDKHNPVWENRNTEEFRERLQLGYQLLYKGISWD